MMLALFVPLILFRFTSIAAAILTVLGALGVIVAAQSLTCLISVSISFMAALVLRLSDRISAAGLATKSLVIIFLSLLAIAGVGVDIGALKSIVVAWQQVKAESITAHLSNFETQVDAHPLSFLGVAPTGVMGECGWLNLLLNQGILLTALYGVFYNNRHCACGECSAELFYTGKRSVIWSFLFSGSICSKSVYAAKQHGFSSKHDKLYIMVYCLYAAYGLVD